jgi:hypothetical protein
MDSDSYVTQAGWLRTTGRVDAIDEVADQFERPVATSLWELTAARAARSVWPAAPGAGWARSAVRWPNPTRLLRSA